MEFWQAIVLLTIWIVGIAIIFSKDLVEGIEFRMQVMLVGCWTGLAYLLTMVLLVT